MHPYRRPAPAGLDLQAKLNSDKYSGSFVKHVSARDLTLRYVQDHGFSGPLVVSDKTGLGLRVPSPVINATDIAKYAKETCPAVILGGGRFDPTTTTIGDWSSRCSKAAFEQSDQLQALPPAVRIEFSNTPMARHVDAPRLVRQVDWVDRAWPKDFKPPSSSATDSTYPKVQKYCVIAMRNCYEGFSTGAGGSSTWFHVLRGPIVFWLLPPVERNLTIYDEWVGDGRPENRFLGDVVEECQRFELEEGKTLFLPSGWIFAMFLTKNSLIFHGSFVHSFAVSMQHRVWEIENRYWMSLSTYPFFEDIHWYVLERYVHCLTGRSFLAKNANDNENSQSKIGSVQSSRGTGQLTECYVVEPEKKGLRDLVAWLSTKRRCDNVPVTITNARNLLLAGEELVARLDKEDVRGTRGTGSSCDRKAFMLRWPEDDEDEETIQYFKPLQSQSVVGPPQSVGGTRGRPPSSKSLVSRGGSSSGTPLRVLANAAAKTQQPGIREGDAAVAAAVTARFIASHGSNRTAEGVSLPGTVDSFRLGDSCCDGSGSCNNTALRKNGCGKCEPCTRDNCGECIYCKDMPKFGGNGRMKQACLKRRCVVLAQSKMENGYKDASALKVTNVDVLAGITSSDAKILSAGRGMATKVSDSSSIQAAKGSEKLCPKAGASVPATMSTVPPPPPSTVPSSVNSKRPYRPPSVVGHHGPCRLTDGGSDAEQRCNDRPVSTSSGGQYSTCSEAKHCCGSGKSVSTSSDDQCSTCKEDKHCSRPGKLKSAFLERPGSSLADKPCTTADADRPRNLVKTIDASKHARETATRRQKSDNSDKKQTKIEVGATPLSNISSTSVARPVPHSNSTEKSFGVQSRLASVLAKPQKEPKERDFLATIALRVVSSDQAATARSGVLGTTTAVHPPASTSLLVADPHRTCVAGADITVKQHKFDAQRRPEASVPAPPSTNVAVSTETSSAALKRKTAIERCHECDGCKRSNCGRCGYCRDMKKNGGPGKMRKACVQRRCAQFSAAAPAGGALVTDQNLQSAVPPPTVDQQTVPSSSSLLQSMASQQLVSSTSLVPAPTAAKQLRPEAPSPVITASSGAGVVTSCITNAGTKRHSTASGTTDASATANKLSVNNLPTPKAQSARSHVLWRLKSQDRCLRCEGCKRKNCGTCVRCRDMKQFGGPGRLKKACYGRICTGMSDLAAGAASPPASQVLTSAGRSTTAASTTTTIVASTTTTIAATTRTAASTTNTTAAPATATTAASTTTAIAASTTTTAIATTSSPVVPDAAVQQPKTATPDARAPKYKPAAHTKVLSSAQHHSIGHTAALNTRLATANENATTNATTSRGTAANDAHVNAAADCKDQEKAQRIEVRDRSVRKRPAPDSAATSSTNPKLRKQEHLPQPKLRTRRRTDRSSISVEHAAANGLLGLASVHSSRKERYGTVKRRTSHFGSAAASDPATVAPVSTPGKSFSVLRLASRPKGDGPKDTGIFIPSCEEVQYRGEAEKRQASEPADADAPDPAATAAAVSALPIEAAPVQQQQPSIAVAATAVAASDAAAAGSPTSPRKRLHADSAAAVKSGRDSSSSSSPLDCNAMSPAKRQRLDRVGRGVACRCQCCADVPASSRSSSSSAIASVASAHSRGRTCTEPAADLQEQHGRSPSKQCHRSPDKHQPKKQKDLPASAADSNGRAEQSGNCGKCTACRDMRCFGGPGKLKKACASRKTSLSASSAIASGATVAQSTMKLAGQTGMVTRNNSAAPTVKRPSAASSHINVALTRFGANGGIVESSSVTGTRASATIVKRKAIRK